MSSVPKVPPETMKKVAATRGHKVRRTNCCFWDFAGGGVTGEEIFRSASCGFQAGELVAVANFDVVLPSDSLSPPRPLPPRLLVAAIPGIPGSWFANSRIQLFGCCAKRIFRKFFAEGQWPEVTGRVEAGALACRVEQQRSDVQSFRAQVSETRPFRPQLSCFCFFTSRKPASS